LLTTRQDWGNPDFFTSEERSRLVRCDLDRIPNDSSFETVCGGRFVSGENLLSACVRHGLCEVAALCEDAPRRAVFEHTMGDFFCGDSLPDTVKDYYGAKVAYYFAFQNFYMWWLTPPAILGAALWYYRPKGTTVDNSPLAPLFALFVVVWAFFFLRLWQRECAARACKWDTYDSDEKDVVRTEYYGELRISPITNKEERYYEPTKRLGWYLFSAAVTCCMLGVAFSTMILSLNLQGYVHGGGPDSKGLERAMSIFHFKDLAALSREGALFDMNSNFMSLVPVLIHCVAILILNSLYRGVAEWLTHLENHRFEHEHENSLIIKRFAFEAFDCYLPLFYIAFFEQCIIKLRGTSNAILTPSNAILTPSNAILTPSNALLQGKWSLSSPQISSEGSLPKLGSLTSCSGGPTGGRSGKMLSPRRTTTRLAAPRARPCLSESLERTNTSSLTIT